MTTLNTYYAFTQSPFSRAIPANDLFPSRGHQEVQARLAFALPDRLPLLITGDIGTGKSTAVRAFVHSLDRNLHPLVYLANPKLNPTALYSQILLALQEEPAHAFTRLLPQLRNTLQNLAHKTCPELAEGTASPFSSLTKLISSHPKSSTSFVSSSTMISTQPLSSLSSSSDNLI